jgi:hypothetical protein
MDAAAHYRHLLTLQRDEFLAAAAPAMLVRYRARWVAAAPAAAPDDDLSETMDVGLSRGRLVEGATEMELYPLAKKPGAAFPDRITIGRTSNNDVVIADHSVSRFHAYVRHTTDWVVADAGSKNGTWIGDMVLGSRREATLSPGITLRLGDVRLTFYRSSDLFDRHGGSHAGR